MVELAAVLALVGEPCAADHVARDAEAIPDRIGPEPASYDALPFEDLIGRRGDAPVGLGEAGDNASQSQQSSGVVLENLCDAAGTELADHLGNGIDTVGR